MLHKPYAFECISKESEMLQAIEIKQELACKAMGELRRSTAILYAPLDVECQKYICCFMCVIVGLTTVEKLEVFLHILKREIPARERLDDVRDWRNKDIHTLSQMAQD